MQTENFYSKIRENLENSDFSPDWDKSRVWQRIEQKQDVKKRFVWWKAAAAGIVMLGLAGVYGVLADKTSIMANKMEPRHTPSAKSPQPLSVEARFNESALVALKDKPQEQNTGRKAHKKNGRSLNEVKPFVPEPNENSNETFDNLVTTEDGEQEFSYNNVTSRNEPAYVRPVIFDAPIIFRPSKPVDKVAAAVAPAKRERVAILEIPEDEDDYVIAPKEKKKSRQARLARQVDKTPEAADPNKPNKIWAFVKQSFKNESIPADSTVK